jgi:hypothetical protein
MEVKKKENDFIRMCIYKSNKALLNEDFINYGYWMKKAAEYEKVQKTRE